MEDPFYPAAGFLSPFPRSGEMRSAPIFSDRLTAG